MNDKTHRIGISGGTFDPIHLGHLIIAQEIKEVMKLNKIIFIPSGRPPHKRDHRVTDPIHRYNMVEMAIVSNGGFEASDMEIKREGYSYTCDTLYEIKKTISKNDTLFFITGADVIPQMHTWKNIWEVFKLCEFVAVLRPDFKKDEMEREADDLRQRYDGVIHIIETPLIGISSTDIRQRVKGGRPIKYLVPENVEGYIKDNKLYEDI